MFAKTNKEPLASIKKGREFETMPFFLSDEFKTILEDKVKTTNGQIISETTDSNPVGGMMEGSSSGGGNLYKSGFLKEKIIEQNEKRKRERKSKKPGDDRKTDEKTPAVKKRGAKDGDDGQLAEEV